MHKYLIYTKYIQPYEILFIQGIIEFILGVITLIITTKFDEIDNFFDFIQSLDRKEIGLIIAMIICQFFIYSIQIKIIDIFSPFHVFLLDILNDFIQFFIMIDKFDSNLRIIISTIVCIIVCFVMILIFIEIIELNFCGLSYMTKKNIELRARQDPNITNKDDDRGISFDGYSLSLKKDKINKLNDVNELIPIDRDSFYSISESIY